MKRLVATIVGAACIGAGAGAGVYAALSPASTTVVRQVAVPSGQTAASASSLSVGDVYNRTHKGVVEITVTSNGNDGVGFAIPSNTVKSVVTQLIAGGKVQHAYLGVGISGSGSAKLTNIVSGAPADKAGVQVGDVVTAVDGTTVTTGDELRAAIAAKSPGDTISVTYTRGGATHTASVK